ncbi:hypothetical protein C8Q72DRAFT_197000 [Fomitopsis betulina]|nr:hypothetical protein C8Q72DRAFT_197000 [Fomitopsis betulina]
MAATPVSDTASILSHTSYASSSSSLSSTSSSSSRSSGATRSSGRGGAGNIKYSSTECLSIAEDPEPDDAVSVAPGREAPVAKQTSAHTTGRNGAGNIASSTIVHKASRVASPDQHALTAALVSAQTEVVTRYERMLVKASLDEARNGRRSYGRGGAGNSASPAKSKASNSPKVVKRSRSLLLNYGSFRGSRSSSVDATIPEESEDLQTTINVSRKKMRKALSRSFLSLRTSHPTSTTALAAPTTAPSSPPTSAMSELSSPSSSAPTLSSPELSVSTPSTSAPSSPLSGKIVEGPVGDVLPA